MKLKKLILVALLAACAVPVQNTKAEFSAEDFAAVGWGLFSTLAVYLGYRVLGNAIAERKYSLFQNLCNEMNQTSNYGAQYMEDSAFGCYHYYCIPNFKLRKLVREFYAAKAQQRGGVFNQNKTPTRSMQEIFKDIVKHMFGYSSW